MSLILSWPWGVYVWALGIALCFSAWGWSALVLLLLGAVFFRGKAVTLGVLAAFVSGQAELGAVLLVAVILLFLAKFAAALVIGEAAEAREKSQEAELSANVARQTEPMWPVLFPELSQDQLESMLQGYRDNYRSHQQRGGDKLLRSLLKQDRQKAATLPAKDRVQFLVVIEMLEQELL